MADISKVKLPDNTEYNIKDSAARSGSARDSTKMPLAGGTFTGRVAYNNVSMPLSAGKVTSLAAGTTEIFKDGIAISNPATSNDVGWMRVTGTGESDTVLEIATGDDGGGTTAETIVVRQYNTSNAIAHEAKLLDPSGNTSFPGNVTSPKFIGALQGNAATATSATKATQDSDGNTINSTYLKLSGGTLTGNLTISHATSADMSASSANPKITFAENGTQPVHLIYTDYDNYRNPAGLKVIGGANATPAWFEVEGSIYNGGSLYTSAAVCANTANSGSAGGLALYGTSPTDYGIAFRGTGNGGKHGYVQGDWAQYHYMAGADTRGWVFNAGASTGVASISRAGHMVLNGSLTVGGNAANTSGARMVYNATLNCIDFTFVA